MDYSKKITAMLTGAAASMIALIAIELALAIDSHAFNDIIHIQESWTLLFSSSISTLLVMSLLHSKLTILYDSLAERETIASLDARTDSLTGLGNRKFLIEQLQTLSVLETSGECHTLLFMDLNNFKRVNDTFGHQAGDQLITMVGERLREKLPQEIIARLGGDEFAVVSRLSGLKNLARLCSELVDVVGVPYLIDGTDTYVGASIGATICEPGLGPSELMRRADIAMYHAKGRNLPYKIFDDDMKRNVDRKILLEQKLKDALRGGEHITAHFQPIVSKTFEVVGLEALLRWRDPELGDVSPHDAIAAAESSNLSDHLGMLIAERACEAAICFPNLTITMNLTPPQLMGERFCRRLLDLIEDHGLTPQRFQLEIAEHAFVERAKDVQEAILPLHKAGFHLATDDFGTSSSSLSHLRSAQIGTVKFDRSLLLSTRRMGTIALMKARIHLAKTLGLKIVCEGVSDAEDEAIALQAGCDFLQGFYYYYPMPLAECLLTFEDDKHLQTA